MIKLLTLAVSLTGLLCAANTVRVSEPEIKKSAVAKADPEYPTIARQMRVAGRVQLELQIDSEGNVEKATVVTGNPLLTPAAVNAARKWRFTPFTMNGKACQAVSTLTFDFRI